MWPPCARCSVALSFVMFQLETPIETVTAALAAARAEGARTILDPAPAVPLSSELLSSVDILTPNESEACLLLGRPVSRVTLAEAPSLGRELRKLGPGTVILKLGEQGCYCLHEGGEIHSPGFTVEVQRHDRGRRHIQCRTGRGFGRRLPDPGCPPVRQRRGGPQRDATRGAGLGARAQGSRGIPDPSSADAVDGERGVLEHRLFAGRPVLPLHNDVIDSVG